VKIKERTGRSDGIGEIARIKRLNDMLRGMGQLLPNCRRKVWMNVNKIDTKKFSN